MTDTQLLDWLDHMKHMGIGLISDDNGHWAVSGCGMQNVPFGNSPCDIETSFVVEAHEWKDTVREAINAYITEYDEDYAPSGHGKP